MPTRKALETQPGALSMARTFKSRQLDWARSVAGLESALEHRQGQISCVLKKDEAWRNTFHPHWWNYIERKKRHRWARALNSSQAFAVNLFGPVREDTACARDLIAKLLPHREFTGDDEVSVAFEYSPEGIRDWLGEAGQTTQIDVYFKVVRHGAVSGHVLVEVKFTETGFGSCRGWSDSARTPSDNPDTSRCLDLAGILRDPSEQCWLAKEEHRRYWELIGNAGSSIRLLSRQGLPCPFRRGLYQLMRSRVLADELKRRTGADWVEVAVCRHPDNTDLLRMRDDLAGSVNPIEAFRMISIPGALQDWRADSIVREIAALGSSLSDWATWMARRYFT